MTTSAPAPALDPGLTAITVLHTLGPAGTNCEAAAGEWFRRQGRSGQVVLHPTLEQGLAAMPAEPGHALLGCVVYPELHTLVFGNLGRIRLVDCFVMPTFHMVVASRDGRSPRTVATHPAPRLLVPAGADATLVDSNARAAIECAAGRFEGCVTTSRAARDHGLTVVTDYGAVPMGFTVHALDPAAPTR